jgi:hypothetical protein
MLTARLCLDMSPRAHPVGSRYKPPFLAWLGLAYLGLAWPGLRPLDISTQQVTTCHFLRCTRGLGSRAQTVLLPCPNPG